MASPLSALHMKACDSCKIQVIKKTNYQMMNIRTKSIFVLILLGIVDVVIPIPIIGLMLIYVIVQKPSWLLDLAQEIYRLG
ncbi:MAG: hypothetical protein OET57_20275 [Desulfobacteraceae bacterium]|nr:hypothetical protein [Desulfobacteraceae bacterium]